jgi:hypothetical protein
MKQLRCEPVGLDDCIVDAAIEEDVMKKAIEHMWERAIKQEEMTSDSKLRKKSRLFDSILFPIRNNQINVGRVMVSRKNPSLVRKIVGSTVRRVIDNIKNPVLIIGYEGS